MHKKAPDINHILVVDDEAVIRRGIEKALESQGIRSTLASSGEKALELLDTVIFDLALVAALIQHQRLDERVDWDAGVFAPDQAYQPALFEPARTVMTVAGHRVYGGKNIVAQVAGGVRGDLMSVLNSPRILRQMDRLANFAVEGRAPKLPEGRWWWDAAK